MNFVQTVLETITHISIYFFEFAGIAVIIFTGIKCVYLYVKHSAFTRITLAKGLALGLEFKLGSEIMRTVIVREISEIIFVGAIILLRAALSFIIHKEIEHEKKLSE